MAGRFRAEGHHSLRSCSTCKAPSIVLLAFHDARYGTLAAMMFPRASTQSMEIFETKVIVGGWSGYFAPTVRWRNHRRTSPPPQL